MNQSLVVINHNDTIDNAFDKSISSLSFIVERDIALIESLLDLGTCRKMLLVRGHEN